jgi:translocation protein SEC63
LIQAVAPESPPLLQLPHFDEQTVKAIEEQLDQRSHLTIQAFMNFPDARRRELASSAGLSTPQLDTAISVASQLPRLVIERTFFKVTGEKHIIPNSLVQFVVKARFIPPGTRDIPDVHPSDLEDIDPDETDTKANARADPAEQKQHQPPLTHAPHFSRDHSPRWHLFLADARQGKVAVPPFTFTTFDKPILDEAGKPTFAVQTLKMQFQAPPQPAHYKFQMHLACDSYIGFDDKRDVVLSVEDPSSIEEAEWEDEDISEPEEGEFFASCLDTRRSNTWLTRNSQILSQVKWLLCVEVPPRRLRARRSSRPMMMIAKKVVRTRKKRRRARRIQTLIPTKSKKVSARQKSSICVCLLEKYLRVFLLSFLDSILPSIPSYFF